MTEHDNVRLRNVFIHAFRNGDLDDPADQLFMLELMEIVGPAKLLMRSYAYDRGGRARTVDDVRSPLF